MVYLLHRQLELVIETKNSSYRKYFDNEYLKLSSHEPSPSRIRIRVYIQKQLPTIKREDLHKSVKFKRLLRQQFLVRGLSSGNVTIFMKDSLAGRLYAKNLTLFLQTHLIEPIMYLKLLDKDILFMHAAGVSDGKFGYLFPAFGGTGKTTLTLGLMAEDMQVLGDDLLLVDAKSGIVHPYLRPLHLFAYNLHTLKNARIPFVLKVKIKIKDLLRFVLENITKQEFLIATRVHPESLYPEFKPAKSVPIRKLVFLTKEGRDEKTVITDKSLVRLAEKIVNSEDLNKSLYANLLDEDEVKTVRQREIKVIKKIITKVGHFEIVNTRLLDFNDLSDFKKRLIQS